MDSAKEWLLKMEEKFYLQEELKEDINSHHKEKRN